MKYDPENRPAIANLMNLYSGTAGTSIEQIEAEFGELDHGTCFETETRCGTDFRRKFSKSKLEDFKQCLMLKRFFTKNPKNVIFREII